MERADIPFLPATELARQIEQKQVSPVEVVEAYQERIERLDPQLNAYLIVCHDEPAQWCRTLHVPQGEQASYPVPQRLPPSPLIENVAATATTLCSVFSRRDIPDED